MPTPRRPERDAPRIATRAFSDVLAPELWERLRADVMAVVIPLFGQWFLIGAALGTRIRPMTREAQRAADLEPLLRHWIRLGVALGEHVAGDAGTARTVRATPTLEDLLGRQAVLDLEAVSDAGDAYVRNYAGQWWEKFSGSRQRRLRNAIETAQAEGLKPKQVAEMIAPAFGAAQALSIATTEMTRLMGGGAVETYRQMGYQQWQWQTVKDSLVDVECRRLQGKVFPITQPFEPAHVNCRCFPRPYGKIAAPAAGPAPVAARPPELTLDDLGQEPYEVQPVIDYSVAKADQLLSRRGFKLPRVNVDEAQRVFSSPADEGIFTPRLPGQINLNPQTPLWRYPRTVTEQSARSGWDDPAMPPGPENVVIHESGHKIHYDRLVDLKASWRNQADQIQYARSRLLDMVHWEQVEKMFKAHDLTANQAALDLARTATPATMRRIAGEVSTYATQDAREFVASVFTGLIRGRTYSENVLNLYTALAGPPVE